MTRKSANKASLAIKPNKQIEALRFRQRGKTYSQIAEIMRCTASTAHKYVKDAIAELNEKCFEEAKMVQQIEVNRLDIALDSIWDRVEKGDLPAIYAFLKISEQRAKLFNLYHIVGSEGIKEMEAINTLAQSSWMSNEMKDAIGQKILTCSQDIRAMMQESYTPAYIFPNPKQVSTES